MSIVIRNRKKKEKWYQKNFPGQLITTYEGKNLSQDADAIIKKFMKKK